MNKSFNNLLFECANILLALISARAIVIYLKLSNEVGDLGLVVGVIIFYLIIINVNRILSNKYNHAYLGMIVVAFFQVYFLNYSIFHLGIYLSLVYVSSLIVSRCKLSHFSYHKFVNGILISVPLFFITKYFSYSIFGFGWFFLVPLVAHLENRFIEKLFKCNFFWILSLAVLFSDRVLVLISILLISCVLSVRLVINKQVATLLYLISAVVIFNYNPLYAMGLIDTVEEGFWLGWWQRVIGGEVLYKDFWIYHPPLLLNLLKIWGVVFGVEVGVFRGFLESLRLLGLVILNGILIVKVKNNLIRGVGFVVLSVICFGLVKNNIEIRSAFALLAILLGSRFLETEKKIFGIFTGLILGVSLGISIETGIGSVIGVGLMMLFGRAKRKSSYVVVLCGLCMGLLLWIFTLISGGLNNFVILIGDYAMQFSRGYLGLNIDLPITQNILNFDVVVNYFSSNGVWWLVTIGLVVWLGKYVWKNRRDVWLIGMFGYCLFMLRVALGRSDWQHLAFLILPLVLMTLYVIWRSDEKFEKKHLLVFGLLVFMFGKQQLIEFGNSILQRWQSFGVYPGSTIVVNEERWKGMVSGNDDVGELFELTKYIRENSKENLFVFPWRPEVYFMVNGKNPTKSDVPIAYIDEFRQKKIIEDLDKNKNKTIIYYEESRNIGGVGGKDLKLVNEYILNNFKEVGEFKNGKVMVYFEGGKDK